ncbi:MAG: RNA 2',3'-cyclic phosphodiesterase [Candidatus Hydrogenedens sp.]|nr:RNA 2',3'-cyclic phosphodiesterase [Candidatus Hydrogenedens sp.]
MRRRLFAGVAVEATDELRRRAEEWRRALGGRVRWVRMENLHLTLEFFGETEEEWIPRLEQALACAARAVSGPMDLALGKAGVYGSPRHPRVLWLGGESAGLSELHARVQEALREAGWQPDARPYSPHLTLGRFKAGPVAFSLDRWPSMPDAPVTCPPVQELILFESVRGPAGVAYERRNRWRLGG